MNLSLAAPLSSMLATEGFNMTRSADTGGTRIHGGVDLRAPVGTPVFAASRGRVLFGGQYNDGSGGAVELDHGDGMVTRDLHLSQVNAATGSSVSKGQQIGLTGYAVSPHLHFDAWVVMPKLPEYVSRFGAATSLGSLTKTWNGAIYVKVPAEPLAPMNYQDDVIASAKANGVSLYNPLSLRNPLVLLAIAGLGGFLVYSYLDG